MQMNLNVLAKEIHDNAVAHGWWDREISVGELIALCHSELSEALEEYRENRSHYWRRCEKNDPNNLCQYLIRSEGDGKTERILECVKMCDDLDFYCPDSKPEGIAVELIDCIIRILDFCGRYDINVDKIMRDKCEYNKNRPYRHGGKAL